MASNKSANWTTGVVRGTGSVSFDDGGVSARLQMYAARLKDPMPALMEIEALFSFMEQERFATGGESITFGILDKWAPVTEETLQWRRTHGGSDMAPPLTSSGYLARAAINPQVEQTSKKSLILKIDPRSQGAPNDVNYGVFHQLGSGVPRRAFAEFPPAFWEDSKIILRYYILGGESKKPSRMTQNETGFEAHFYEERKPIRKHRDHAMKNEPVSTSRGSSRVRIKDRAPDRQFKMTEAKSKETRHNDHMGASRLGYPATSGMSSMTRQRFNQHLLNVMDTNQFKTFDTQAAARYGRGSQAYLQHVTDYVSSRMPNGSVGMDRALFSQHVGATYNFMRKEAQSAADRMRG